MKRIIQCLIGALLTAGSLQAAMVAEWKFDETSGSNAVDSVGGFDGTVAQSTEWVTGGVSGGALNFANNNEVVLPVEVLDSISTTVTLSMWIFGNDQQPASDYCFAAFTAAGGKVITTHLPDPDEKMIFDTGNASGYERVWDYAGNTAIYKGRWNHWVLTKDATSGEKNMYVNGELFTTISGKTKLMTDAVKATIGSKGGSHFYQGLMDEVQLYDTVLSADDVAFLFDSYGYVAPNIPPVAESVSLVIKANTPENFSLPGYDPEGSNVTYTIVSLPSFGTLETNGALPEVTYTPNADYAGVDSFTYTVNDGELDSTLGTVSIEVRQPMTWNPAQTYVGDSDVSTNGTFKFAAAFGTTGDVTVNGVVFKGAGSNTEVRNSSSYGSDLSYQLAKNNDTAFHSGDIPFFNLSPEYRNLLKTAIYQSISDGVEESFTLGNLTPGNTYEVQIWISDPRSAGAGRYCRVDDSTDIYYNAAGASGGVGQYAIGTFTPLSTTYSFTLVALHATDDTKRSIQLNALQLRDVTPIPPGIVGNISIEVLSDSTVALSWETSAHSQYGVEAMNDLVFDGWNTIISNVPGNGAEVTITNTISGDAEFYRAYRQ